MNETTLLNPDEPDELGLTLADRMDIVKTVSEINSDKILKGSAAKMAEPMVALVLLQYCYLTCCCRTRIACPRAWARKKTIELCSALRLHLSLNEGRLDALSDFLPAGLLPGLGQGQATLEARLLEMREGLGALHRILATRTDADERRLLEMRAIQGLSWGQMADQLGCSLRELNLRWVKLMGELADLLIADSREGALLMAALASEHPLKGPTLDLLLKTLGSLKTSLPPGN